MNSKRKISLKKYDILGQQSYIDGTLLVHRIRQRKLTWTGKDRVDFYWPHFYCQKSFMGGTEGASILIFRAMNVNNSLCRIYELFYLSVFPQSFHAVRLISLSLYSSCTLQFGYTVHKMDMNCILHHTRRLKAVTSQSQFLNFCSKTQQGITCKKYLNVQILQQQG